MRGSLTLLLGTKCAFLLGLTLWPSFAIGADQYCISGSNPALCFGSREAAEAELKQGPPEGRELMVVWNDSMSLIDGKLRQNWGYRAQPRGPLAYGWQTIIGCPQQCVTPNTMCGFTFSGYCATEALAVQTAVVWGEGMAGSDRPVSPVLSGAYADMPQEWGPADLGCTSPEGGKSLRKHFYNVERRVDLFGASGAWLGFCRLDKQEIWFCPAGYSFVASHTSQNFSLETACSGGPQGAIYSKHAPRQAQSCQFGNPCVPAAGTKRVAEMDFDWRGLRFMRHYNSARDLPSDAFLGEAWSHTLAARLLSAYPDQRILMRTEENLLEVFVRITNEKYRSETVAGLVLEANPTPPASGLPVLSWILKEPSGRRTYFDVDGRAVRVDHSIDDGRFWHFEYCDTPQTCGAAGALTRVVDETGRSLRFTYEPVAAGTLSGHPISEMRLATIQDDGGVRVSFGYDSEGRLAAAQYPELGGLTSTRQYHYNERSNICIAANGSPSSCEHSDYPYHITGITDERNVRVATYTYDGLGRITSSQSAGGVNRHTVTYGSDTLSTVSLPSGKLLQITTKLDEVRKIERMSDSAGARSFLFDAALRVTQSTDQLGGVAKFEYADGVHETARVEAFGTPDARRIERSWDSISNRLAATTVRDASGASKLEQSTIYNGRGQVISRSAVDPGQPATRVVTFSYCEPSDVAAGLPGCPLVGLRKTLDGPRTDVSDVVGYAYYETTDLLGCGEPAGPCHYRGDLRERVNAAGHASTVLRYDHAGRVVALRDANGVIREFTYHPRGWVLTRTSRGAIPTEDATTTFTYDLSGNVLKITHPDGDYLAYEYDAAGRMRAVVDPLGNRAELTLNAAGERTGEVIKNSGAVITHQLSRVYDQLGRLDLERDAQQRIVSDFGYDASGNLTSMVDALGTETRQTYDPLSRLKQRIEDYRGLEATTSYAYDIFDRATRVTDPKGLSTVYTFNAFGDLTHQASPDSGISTFQHDAAGNVVQQVDARGVVATHTYDALNRRVRTQFTGSSAVAAFFYDEMDAITGCSGSFSLGRLTRITDPSGSTTYCYDRRGNVNRKIQTVGTNSPIEIAYTYTLGDRVAETDIWPVYRKTLTSRDARGRPIGIRVEETWPCGGNCGLRRKFQIANSGSYRPFGPLASWAWPSATTTTHTYDLNYRLSGISSSGSGLSLNYEFDAAGNLTATQSPGATPEPRREFEYDALHRLLNVRDSRRKLVEGFTYDSTGNRLSHKRGTQTTAYSYGTSKHWLTSVGGIPRAYDAAGNTTQASSTRVFSFDVRNRLVDYRTGPAEGSIVARYDYNGRGERVRKVVAGVETLFAYDEKGNLILELEPVSGKSRTYAFLDELLVGLVQSESADVRAYALQGDHLGVARVVLGPLPAEGVPGQPAVARRWEWPLTGSAFGDHSPNADPDGDDVQFSLPFRFPGQYADTESGLFYNYFRDYEPGTGRYLETDPAGLHGGMSTYAYAVSSPLVLTDPFGLKPGDSFQNVVSALNDIRRVAPTLQPNHFEHGGWIFPIGTEGCVTYNALTSKRSSTLKYDDLMARKPADPLAAWHTHGFRGRSDPSAEENLFSGVRGGEEQDTGFAEALGVVFYLIAPAGSVKGYDPATNSFTPDVKDAEPCMCEKASP
jgi:RHS repeat-associated protein